MPKLRIDKSHLRLSHNQMQSVLLNTISKKSHVAQIAEQIQYSINEQELKIMKKYEILKKPIPPEIKTHESLVANLIALRNKLQELLSALFIATHVS